MADEHVTAVVEHDASAGLGVVHGVHESNERRSLNLLIEPRGERFHLTIQTADRDLQDAFGDELEHDLPITRAELLGLVQACRSAWRTHVVDARWQGEKVFVKRWDFAGDAGPLQAALPKVAEAGSKLFLALFYPRPAENPEAYAGLRKIGRVLREQMSGRTRWLRVTSDSFYVPWSLIYSDALKLDGSDVRPEGFWGYQHLIEHTPPAAGNLGNELQAPDGPLEVGVQMDATIDQTTGVPCLAPVMSLLGKYADTALVRHERRTRNQLAAALRDGPVTDQVLFFCCHGQQEGDLTNFRADEAYLILTDRDGALSERRITPADLLFWMDLKELERHPLVFLNACGAGQLNSVFYASFGRTLLGLGASSVIGAQTDLPAVFAGAFAQRFFDAFFQGGLHNKVGHVLFRLRRELLDRHHNPLGLIYSLYRGADSFLPQEVKRA